MIIREKKLFETARKDRVVQRRKNGRWYSLLKRTFLMTGVTGALLIAGCLGTKTTVYASNVQNSQHPEEVTASEDTSEADKGSAVSSKTVAASANDEPISYSEKENKVAAAQQSSSLPNTQNKQNEQNDSKDTADKNINVAEQNSKASAAVSPEKANQAELPTEGQGKEQEYTGKYDVSSGEEFSNIVNNTINQAAAGKYLLSLKKDIILSENPDLFLQNNETTIWGNGHVISSGKKYGNLIIGVKDGATLNLGNKDDPTNTLTVQGSASTGGLVNVTGNGSKLNMYEGTTLKDAGPAFGTCGGVAVDRGAIFHMYGGTIENCRGMFAGGVLVDSASAFYMQGGKIVNCKGNGICAQNATVTISGGEVSHNVGKYGGGVCLSNGSTADISGGIICNNYASNAGADIYVSDTSKVTLPDAKGMNKEYDAFERTDKSTAGRKIDGWYWDYGTRYEPTQKTDEFDPASLREDQLTDVSGVALVASYTWKNKIPVQVTVNGQTETYTYDGKAHTYPGRFTYAYLVDGESKDTLPNQAHVICSLSLKETDAGKYAAHVTGDDFTISGLSADDYDIDYVINTQPELIISPRNVTLTSRSYERAYNGLPLTNANFAENSIAVGGDGWAEGEGATYTFTGSQTKVGSSRNTFTYQLNNGTKQKNYIISVVEGELRVTEKKKNNDPSVPKDNPVPKDDQDDHKTQIQPGKDDSGSTDIPAQPEKPAAPENPVMPENSFPPKDSSDTNMPASQTDHIPGKTVEPEKPIKPYVPGPVVKPAEKNPQFTPIRPNDTADKGTPAIPTRHAEMKTSEKEALTSEESIKTEVYIDQQISRAKPVEKSSLQAVPKTGDYSGAGWYGILAAASAAAAGFVVSRLKNDEE